MTSTRSKRRAAAAAAITGCTLAIAVIDAAPASAVDESHPNVVTCEGDFGAIVIKDDLLVPEHASCNLLGTIVRGDVFVNQDAQLAAYSAEMRAGLHMFDGAQATLVTSKVLGATDSQNSGSIELDSNVFTGQAEFTGNTKKLILINSTFKDDVRIMQNTGGVSVKGNLFVGSLDCLGNKPSPNGGSNTIRGQARGQCAKFAKPSS
jgi:hypothetical protein